MDFFTPMVLAQSLVDSMRFNPRGLEATGYTIGNVLLQSLISGYEAFLLLGPQYPIYISPKDSEESDDLAKTLRDSQAKGVYVDGTVVFPVVTLKHNHLNFPNLSAAFNSRDNDLRFDVISMQIPLLEERKRAPSRSPDHAEQYIRSLCKNLFAAQKQIVTQTQILYSSRRYVSQELVILLATAGRYYRLAVVKRSHPSILQPSTSEIQALIKDQEDDIRNLEMETKGADAEPNELLDLKNPAVRKKLIEEQNKARDQRALAREKRKAIPNKVKEIENLVNFVKDQGGEPPYPDDYLETSFKYLWSRQEFTSYQRYENFFEPEPNDTETVESFAQIQNPESSLDIVFTGVIHVESQTSEKFITMIRKYFDSLRQIEEERREKKF